MNVKEAGARVGKELLTRYPEAAGFKVNIGTQTVQDKEQGLVSVYRGWFDGCRIELAPPKPGEGAWTIEVARNSRLSELLAMAGLLALPGVFFAVCLIRWRQLGAPPGKQSLLLAISLGLAALFAGLLAGKAADWALGLVLGTDFPPSRLEELKGMARRQLG